MCPCCIWQADCHTADVLRCTGDEVAEGLASPMTASLQTIVSSSAYLHTTLHWTAICKSFGVALDVVCKATGSLSVVVTLWMSRKMWSSNVTTRLLVLLLVTAAYRIRVGRRLTQICQVRRKCVKFVIHALISLPWFISLRRHATSSTNAQFLSLMVSFALRFHQFY